MSADFSKETLEARRDWQEIFKVMKNRDLQPRLLCSAKHSFIIRGQIKSSEKKKLKEFIIPNHYVKCLGTYLRKRRRSEL